MPHLWDAEKIVSPSLARTLIEKQFPKLKPVQLELLGEGWDNTVYRVNDSCVFRFPRRQEAVTLIETEKRVLPVIAPLLPVAIPLPLFKGNPSEDFSWPFCGYFFLPGCSACRMSMSDTQRIRLAEPLAQCLKILHAIPVSQMADWGVPPDILGRFDLTKQVPKAHQYLEEISQKSIIHDTSPFVKMIEETTGIQNFPEKKSLVHGDFRASHFLIDEHQGLSGIIDWGDVHIGNPANDFSVAHSFLPLEGQSIFRHVYEPIRNEEWLLARFRALYTTLLVILQGHDIGDSDLVREGLQALRYISQRR